MTRFSAVESEASYLSSQLITCIGNKRALLQPIAQAVDAAQQRLGGRKMRILDAFSGSGVVSRLLKPYASELVVNDIEDYARALSACYLTNVSGYPVDAIAGAVADLNELAATAPQHGGFFQRLYAPGDEENITRRDRVFYTRSNAAALDTYCSALSGLPAAVSPLLLGPLLSAASVHANTAGVFKGFYKDRRSGVGRFGGSGSDALARILAPITLSAPVLSSHECDYTIRQADANELAGSVGPLDLAYLDPPYNQHPYGSNYFMLNLVVNYEEPVDISGVSGIPANWLRSGYNVRRRSLPLLAELIGRLQAKFVLLSFNDEGFVPPPELGRLLRSFGRVEEFRHSYNAFRGSRNLAGRSPRVTEHLYLLEKR